MKSKKKRIYGLSIVIYGTGKLKERIIGRRISSTFIFVIMFFVVTIALFLYSIIRFVGLIADWNWALVHLFVHSSYNLRFVLIVLCAVVLSLIPIIILNFKETWKQKFLNKEVLSFLQGYHAMDHNGCAYVLIRHIPHIFLRLLKMGLYYVQTLILKPGSKLTKSSSPVTPSKKERPAYKSHYETFLLDKLKEADGRTGQAFMRFRAINLYQPRQEDLGDSIAGLDRAIKEEFNLIVTLSDYWVCPHCRKSKFPPKGPGISKLWEIIEYCDLLYSRIGLLLDMLSPLGNWKISRCRGELSGNYNDLHDRLFRYYKLIKEELAKTPGRRETARAAETTETTPGFHEKLVDFRLEVLEKGALGSESTDLWLFERRSQVIDIPPGNGEMDAMRLKMVVRTLTCEFFRNRDWPGIMEWYRLLAIKKDYKPGGDDYMDLGEAYWHYAKELGTGPLGEWASAQALKYYYLANAEKHLLYFV